MLAYSYNDPRSTQPSPPTLDPSIHPPSYTRHSSISPNSGVTILLSCPSLSSYSWVLKLYAKVFGGMGVLLSTLWVVGHTYVLYQTEDKELRIQRYVSIFLGLSLLLSHLLLCYGSVQERRATVTLFFILSMAVLVLYWAWFGYLKYGMEDGEASKEVSCEGICLTRFNCFYSRCRTQGAS